jgi:enamine deaminase RidA (YjgF/YER057c/UK114 family)
LSPDTLPKNPAFSQAVVVSGPARTVYVGGQDAITASGTLVGAGDLRAQTEQVFSNLRAALAAANAELHHVVKWTVYVVQGQSLQPGFEVFQREWGDRPNPPAITAAFVAALAHPHFLVEMDAIAVVPESASS